MVAGLVVRLLEHELDGAHHLGGLNAIRTRSGRSETIFSVSPLLPPPVVSDAVVIAAATTGRDERQRDQQQQERRE